MSFLLFFSLLTVPPSSIVCWFLYSICVSSSNLAEIINNSFIFHDAHSSPFSIGEVDIAQRVCFIFLTRKKYLPPFFLIFQTTSFSLKNVECALKCMCLFADLVALFVLSISLLFLHFFWRGRGAKEFVLH